ncbi:MAG TPA: MarR family transcriptional regulator [Trueperaceae bacterium]|nr:MarR family transcriptional regulator [Trueperaceae bacterium]
MAGTFDLEEQHWDLDAKLVAAAERLGQALRVMLRREAQRHGLSPIQLQVLVQVGQRAYPKRVGALAARFDVSAPTLSDAVAALEAKGLVRRRPGTDDRRAVELELTEDGREVAESAEGWAELARGLAAALPRESKLEAFETLTALIAGLQAEGVVTVARMCRTCRFLRQGTDTPYHCALLDLPLRRDDLRVDCPEHEPCGERAVGGRRTSP